MSYKRIVIKVGSAVLSDNGSLALSRLENLTQLIAQLREQYEVILVTSGAVAAGYSQIQLDKKEILNKQALAAIGQPILMNSYRELFSKYQIIVSQVLLTAANFDSRKQSYHAKKVIDVLLQQGILPIINENDTTAIDELVVGDNDQLSAFSAQFFNADLLVILSDISGYYDDNPKTNPNAKVIGCIREIAKHELEQEYNPNHEFATGGIVTKLKAAHYLLSHKKEMFLCSGFDLASLKSFLISGEQNGGTLFKP